MRAMTPVETFRGQRVALFGLGGSGMATAEATLQGDQYPTTFAVGVFAKPLNLPPGQ